MGENNDEAFKAIVLQVSLLLFGPEGMGAVVQRVVAAALIQCGIKEIVSGIGEKKK